MVAPDYPEALIGWRTWLAVLVEGEARLCSPLYSMLWLPGEASSATCRGRERGRAQSAPATHPAPEETCRCGIYASNSVVHAVAYASGPSIAEPVGELRQVVFGRVCLWGRVVECERGWRAEHAYPAFIYVPVLTNSQEPLRWQPDRPRPAAEALVRAISVYRVPVEPISCDTLHHAAQELERRA